MFSFLNTRSATSSPRKRSRRLHPEQLENRRVLAGAIDVCVPLAEGDLTNVPSEESTFPPFGPEIRRNSPDQKAQPFRITGGGPAPQGLPLAPGLPAGPHRATGNAIGLGRYTGEGEFSLAAPLEISESGAVTGKFHGTFVFVAANGDRLATIYGEGGTGTLTGQLSQDAEGNPVVIDVKFDAFFAPDPDNSTGRFANVVGGGWTMIAKSESISLPTDGGGYTAPFDYTWSGTGTLEYAKKAK